MEEYIYCVCKETYLLGQVVYVRCGIAAAVIEDGVMNVIEHIGDISADEQSVRQLADRCNRLKLSPTHLRDVVEDFLVER